MGARKKREVKLRSRWVQTRNLECAKFVWRNEHKEARRDAFCKLRTDAKAFQGCAPSSEITSPMFESVFMETLFAQLFLSLFSGITHFTQLFLSLFSGITHFILLFFSLFSGITIYPVVPQSVFRDNNLPSCSSACFQE